MNRLPVIGSTAKTTAFCHSRLDGPGGYHLFFDGNGKITASNGTLEEPRPNAFSLRNVEDCPQSTPTCRKACYVENLKAAQPDLYALYEHNAATIRTILADQELADAWSLTVAGWIIVHAPGGFRWHVSGDIFSLAYARWIADVCQNSPSVAHWVYTRSFAYLGPLWQVATTGPKQGNLAVNLSCDRDNWSEAVYAATKHFATPDGGHDGPYALRLCYLTTDGTLPPHADSAEPDAELGPDDVVFADYQLRPRQFATLAESPWWQTITPEQRGTVCPVDSFGKSESRRCGPCKRCLT